MAAAIARTEWTEKAHLDLLMAVLFEITPTKNEWDRIMDRHLHPKGYNYTLSAVMQHLQKLRRKEGKDGNEASAPSTPGGPATPATPASARKNAPAIKGTASRSAGKRKMHAEPSIEEHVDDEEEPAFTPSKKAKIEDDGMDDIKQEPSAI